MRPRPNAKMTREPARKKPFQLVNRPSSAAINTRSRNQGDAKSASHAPDRNGFESGNADIAKGQRPTDQKCLEGAERLVGIGHLSTGHGKHRGQLGIAKTGAQHHNATHDERKSGSVGPSLFQSIADKRHPADTDHQSENQGKKAEATQHLAQGWSVRRILAFPVLVQPHAGTHGSPLSDSRTRTQAATSLAAG